jgi:hypothetical protein
MKDKKSLKNVKLHMDALNKELLESSHTPARKYILVNERLHFAIRMMARRHHKTISGVATELLTAGIKATYYKLYLDYMKGPETTFVDFKKAQEK